VADVDFYLSIVDFWIAPMQLIDDVSQLFELHFSFLLQHLALPITFQAPPGG
jgi:hypothetical protein